MRKIERNPIVEQLQKHMKYIYDEDTFYKTCKLSRQEFLHKIEKAKDHKKLTEILDIVYKADVNFGRRGVMSLNETNQIVKRKIAQKERENRFA